ncbi:haloacid dehalogenase-like hydrolase [Streptomyces nanshensis]|uniref:haloacid dehalogenase-like hydrolase n=1 Tax=Streptomyces nanshensis TaxID=518642 RepID=UPI00085C8E38|nr:haloacid dehalogenase-like hydrolase [Streptomyces nanshensis]
MNQRFLHVVGFDHTFCPSTSSSVQLGLAAGCHHEVLWLEAALRRGEMTAAEFAARTHALWSEPRRRLTPEHVAEVFDRAPWIDGLDEVLEDIRARGEFSVLVTMSPDFVANLLQHREGEAGGFDSVIAQPYPALTDTGFAGPFDRATALVPADKPRLVAELRQELGVEVEAVVSYGDSLHDIAAGYWSVAVNAPQAVQDAADASYSGGMSCDFWAVYQLGRGLLEYRWASPRPTRPVS